MSTDLEPKEAADRLSKDLGPDLMSLYQDDDVTEFGANPVHKRGQVWVDRRSTGMTQTDAYVRESQARQFLRRVASFKSTTLTKDDPTIEVSLPDPTWGGARLSGSIRPATSGPAFCIRKFEDTLIPLESYAEDGIMSNRQYDRLIDAIKSYDTIAVVGGTGSGKTTLLMSILNRIGQFYPDERIVSIEDTPELRLQTLWNWHPFYTFEVDQPYKGSVEYLVHKSLRWSPSRIVVGECRGPGIVALFEGILSGHPGGAFTYHATTIPKFFERVLINCMRESDTEEAHKRNIGSAVDLVIILEKAMDERYVKQMAAVDTYSDGDYEYDRIWRDPSSQPEVYLPEKVREGRKAVEANGVAGEM